MQMQQLTLEGRPIENKPFRYITQEEQKEYCDFLEALNLFPDKIKDLKWCASEFMTYDCTNDNSHTTRSNILTVVLGEYVLDVLCNMHTSELKLCINTLSKI